MDTIKECFAIILQGEKTVSRLAARRVRKLLYSSAGREKYKDIKSLVEQAADQYRNIAEEWRQENFVVAISVIYYLHDREAESFFSLAF